MRMKTKQYLSKDKPNENEREIGILIKCPSCNKGRVFKISDNLRLILNRVVDRFRIKSECEGCNKEFEVCLGWISDKEGYSYKDFKDFKEDDSFSVEDLNGLRELK